MKEQILYIGLNVDDQNFHGAAFIHSTGEVIEFKCRPNTKGLVNQLQNLKTKFKNFDFKICYEATYIGFTLQRDLAAQGFVCEVIAPSSIPKVHSNQIKTDRLDASKLAQFYASGLLTIVTPPDIEMEKDRDLMRSRQRLRHINGFFNPNPKYPRPSPGDFFILSHQRLCYEAV